MNFLERSKTLRFGSASWRGLRVGVFGALLAWAADDLAASEAFLPRVTDPLSESWQWQRFSELDGRSPQCMVEGQDGAMWFGLAEGVMRYDGVRWESFPPGSGLAAGAVHAIACTAEGVIYAATETGLSRFTSGRWERVFPAEGGRETKVHRLLAVSDGSVWAGLEGALLRVHGGTLTLFTTERQRAARRRAFPGLTVLGVGGDIPLVGRVGALHESRDGRIWCGLYNGELFHFDARAAAAGEAGAWRLVTAAEGYRKGSWEKAILHASDGTLWVGSGQNDVGINRLDPGTGRWTYYDLSVLLGTDNLVRSIIETRDGAIWVGGLGKLFRFKDGEWRSYRAPASPISAAGLHLRESRSGDLWILSLGDEVQRIDYSGKRWLRYEGLNFQCKTPDGREWFVAVDDAVVSFDGREWRRFGEADGLMSHPLALLCTTKGELWAAGSHAGWAATARLVDGSWRRVVHERADFNFRAAIDYRAVHESPDGNLWFGCYVDGVGTTQGGILQYDPALGGPEEPKAWKRHAGAGYVSSSGIVQGPGGALFSGFTSGIVRYDGRRWERVDILKGQRLDAIGTAPDGDLWIGTRGAGLWRYNGAAVRSYTVADGLIANSVTALFHDRENRLWVGTGRGVSVFDGREWIGNVFAEERLGVAMEGGGFKETPDGTLWLNQSSRDWLRRVLPGRQPTEVASRTFWTVRYRRERTVPLVELVAGETRVNQPGNTVISWRGIDPWWRTREERMLFSYRMDGGPWSKMSGDTSHVFLQLPAGPHVFEVRALDRDLNLSRAPARLEFEVLPPVWRQPWFVGLMAVFLGVVTTQAIGLVRRQRRLAAEIAGHLRTEAALQEKTTRLETEVETRRAIQVQLEEHKRSLEKEIEDRKRIEQQVEQTHRQLLLASRQAGMAEIATNVLHNVGNVLNSVNVSAAVAADAMQRFKIDRLTRLAEVLTQAAASGDAAAKTTQAAAYLKALGEEMTAVRTASLGELQALRSNIEHVKEIVAMQQNYARLEGLAERVKVSELIEDALRMNSAAMQRHEIEIARDFQCDPEIDTERHKVLQILVNLITNAKQACDESGRPDKRITLRIVAGAPGQVEIHVADNGAGIAPENRDRIFNHGFTTRKKGHGFGLHSSANAATELHGKLSATSDGPGTGATFVLTLPRPGDVGPVPAPGESTILATAPSL